MREDKSNQLLASGVSNIFQTWANNLDRLPVINQLDKLKEAELDQLASDRNIFWYDYKASISVKRALIKNAKLVFNRLGTVWAVESVMNDYLPQSELQEWFEYNGEPGYFRLITDNTDILRTDIEVFLNILKGIKRRSVWLEDIILRLKQYLVLYPGIGIVERSKDTFTFTQYLRKGQMEGMTKGEMESLLKGEMER
jgi:hypothetical protein